MASCRALFHSLAFLLVLQSFLSCARAGSLVPVSRQLVARGNSIKPRETHLEKDLLRPQADAHLPYLSDDINSPLLITMTPSHDFHKYIMLEEFDFLLSDLYCTSVDIDETRLMNISFATTSAYAVAKEIWSGEESLIFIAQHTSCCSVLERMMLMSTSLTFDDKSSTVMASGYDIVLGESPEASSWLTIRGRPLAPTETTKFQRRNAVTPKTISVTTLSVPSTWDSREKVFDQDGAALWCNNCSTPSGKVIPYFEYQIDTSFISMFNDNSSIDSLKSIFPIAKLGFTVIETIEARLNLELETRVGIEVDCSFPFGANCSTSFNAGGKFHPDTGKQQNVPLQFLGLQLNFTESFGVNVKLLADVELNMTMPVVATLSTGNILWDINNFTGNDTMPTPNIQPFLPSISVEDPRLCLMFGIGPSVQVSLFSTIDSKLKIGMTAQLDLPRVTMCVDYKGDTQHDCTPKGGPISDAIFLTADINVGLEFNLTGLASQYDKTGLPEYFTEFHLAGPGNEPYCWSPQSSNITLPLIEPGPNNWGSRNFTLGSNGLPYFNNPFISGPNLTLGGGVPGPPFGNGSIGSIQTKNMTSGCASVAPSPGGQPCGAANMTCLGLYSWSCPNGDTGVVPPGAVCECAAFRHPGWRTPDSVTPACTSGVYCFGQDYFAICSSSGIELPQIVAAGTICQNGMIVTATDSAAPTTTLNVAAYIASAIGLVH